MGAIAEQSTFQSSDGHSRIHYEIWYPEGGQPRAVIQMVHGMCEYIGRYRPFAEFLVAHGFVAAGHDHLGHGLSASPDRYGYFGEDLGDQFLVEDVRLMNELLRKRYPDLPILLLGHSMGSFVTRDFVARYGDRIAGYLCLGTAGPNPMVTAGIKMAEHQIRESGPLSTGDRLTKIAMGGYNSKIPGRRSPYDWLSRETSIVDAYGQDSRCTFTFTAAGYRDMFLILKRISSRRWAERIPKTLPILLAAGDADPVGGYGKGVLKVYKLLVDAGIHRVRLKIYPGARHELLNESNRAEVFADLLDFIESCLEEQPSKAEQTLPILQADPFQPSENHGDVSA